MKHTITDYANCQKLVDILFEVALMTQEDNRSCLQLMDQETYMKWVANQLRDCEFPTTPMGASWGVLDK